MDRRDRLRRMGLLCLHCLRNLAFFRATTEYRAAWEREQFWVAAHNNFLDVAVLEWCKVYGDPRAKHHWQKVVRDSASFMEQLTAHLRITEAMFVEYIGEMRVYRDKFIAHLDDGNQMDIPNLSIAIKSAQFLYQWLLENEDDCDAYHGEVANSVTYFRRLYAEAQQLHTARSVD